MRSRASGWNWGLSSAASQPATMSSLRRRAIVVSRARSPGRSSTGGRVSARAAAAESSGSASTRSQAIASRTPARWKGEAALLHRRGDHTARVDRVGEQDADVVGPGPAGEQVLDLARRRLRLGALAGAPPEAQARLAEALLEHDRVAVRVEVAVPGLEHGVGRPVAARLEREELVR